MLHLSRIVYCRAPFPRAVRNITEQHFLLLQVFSSTIDKVYPDEGDAQDNKWDDERNQPLYGYAKRLEFKNQTKHNPYEQDDLRVQIYKRTMTAEESLLTVDFLRKHKAMARDAKRLRKLKKDFPEAAQHFINFKPRPFSHNDPEADRIAQSVIQELKYPQRRPPPSIYATQEVKLPEEERDNTGSLQNLKLRYGTPRPPRPESHMAPFELPLARPDLRSFHQIKPSTMTGLDMHFAEWFIGMTEAQLPFSYTSEGRPYFAVQHNDMQLFRKMRAFLHFGHVDNIKQLWYVMDDENLQRIIRLLDGNLFLESSRRAFGDWVEKYKSLGIWNEEFTVNGSCVWQPQPNNKWLTGFIDSSLGMYAGRLVESPSFPHFRIQLKFWLLSEDRSLLEHLQRTFEGGDIEQDGDYLRWTIKKRADHIKLNRYGRMFRPYSLKNVSLSRYDRLVNYPIISVKTEKAWKRLQNLVDNLNSFERKSALAMTFHPYHHRYKQNAETQMHLARTGSSKMEIKAFKKDKEREDYPWDISDSFSFVEEHD